jgi:hypothetical protein
MVSPVANGWLGLGFARSAGQTDSYFGKIFMQIFLTFRFQNIVYINDIKYAICITWRKRKAKLKYE